MRLANIDKWLAPLSRHLRPTIENCVDLIDAHKRLTDLFHKITGLENFRRASVGLLQTRGACLSY